MRKNSLRKFCLGNRHAQTLRFLGREGEKRVPLSRKKKPKQNGFFKRGKKGRGGGGVNFGYYFSLTVQNAKSGGRIMRKKKEEQGRERRIKRSPYSGERGGADTYNPREQNHSPKRIRVRTEGEETTPKLPVLVQNVQVEMGE